MLDYLQVISCILVKGNQRFGATTFLSLQAIPKFGSRFVSNLSPTTEQEEVTNKTTAFSNKNSLC
jgi:hypothetical protein